ncbi:ABC-2 type transport system permease protein [Amycolatopsis marina]|uniref:ABC-2 type transport system permease protein n=1 Tax=Amycolatopsis marina TaxID=490629 RepID=A0A1I1BGF6_9PSEU|nr:ABC transporter permease [Amycolatopsis marina]SFB47838.1 ABC-2 type transport system permease protein [Amycolatopsis marina]
MNLVGRQLRALFLAEVKLLGRNSAVAATATIFPIGMAAALVYFGRENLGALGWAFPVAMQLLLMFGMTVYITTTLALTSRREDLYLKRLRSGEVADSTVLVGVSSPVIVLGVLQCLLIVVIVGVFGPAVPANPLVLLLAILLGVALSATFGFATTGLVSSTQQADMAAMPFFLFLLATGVWAGTNGAEGPGVEQLVTPGGALVDLAQIAYGDAGSFAAQLVDALPALGVLAVWTAIGAVAARRFFRWEKRI